MRYFIIGCVIGAVLCVLVNLPWVAIVCAVLAIAMADWSGKGDGRQRWIDD
jgi:hypothetical protein